MAHEVTVPLLPCGSIDDIADFYQALGFEVTYRQTKPNPYVAIRREDLHLHFFGMPDFDAATSYGTLPGPEPGCRRAARGVRGGDAVALRQGARRRPAADDPATAQEEHGRRDRLQPRRPGRQLDPRHGGAHGGAHGSTCSSSRSRR
ncbi:hypothetical protein Ahu01nite_042670 [Winogradskya humida]|uniref:Glyoxalase/bleomycin resistance protein/dioxygenase superfamily protein n=1 Tax=Winogradskya humida TaxID=113566 RepID=A0ABQ3ZRF2_9ACTN|nr:hypothetical protein Ahu01nite_042670 [Actinoplanes humidus]